METDDGEEVTLAGIDPDGGYQGSGFEVAATLEPAYYAPSINRGRQNQLVNDEVDDVLRDVHRAGGRTVAV